jgi:hypothetical protein
MSETQIQAMIKHFDERVAIRNRIVAFFLLKCDQTFLYSKLSVI